MNINSPAEWNWKGSFLIKDDKEYTVEKINKSDKSATRVVKNQAELGIVAAALNRKPIVVARDEKGTEMRTVTVKIGSQGESTFMVKVKEQRKKELPKPPVRSRTDETAASPKSPNIASQGDSTFMGKVQEQRKKELPKPPVRSRTDETAAPPKSPNIASQGDSTFMGKVQEQRKKELPKPPVRSRTDEIAAPPKSPNTRATKRQSLQGPVSDNESTE